MLCLKKRRTYSFTQGVCADLPRRSKKDANNQYGASLNMAITTLPRKNRSREERPSRMVLTVTEDTPADMLAGSMELLVQLPREHQVHTQKVTVQRSTPMMDLLVQIATANKLAASSYTLQAIGERGMLLPHQPNTPIGALDALQVKLLPKQGTFVPRKSKQANQPFETTFRLQVHLPRNQLYVSRVSPKMNLGEILEEVCREKNLDKNKYELRHPGNLEETLDLSLSLQDYHLQEVTLYAKQGRTLGSALSTQDIMALQRQEERRRQQAKQGVFGFMFKKSKEGSLSTDSLGGRSTSPARSDETARSASPLQPPARPQRKRRPAPKPPIANRQANDTTADSSKDKVVISHSRNSSDSSGYHEASVLSDNPDSAGRLPETLPRRNRAPGALDTPRNLAHTSQSSKSLGNLATVSGTLSHGISSTSLSSTGQRKKRAAPLPPVTKPLSSAISAQALERIVDSEESLTSDMDPSKPPSDIGAPSKASSDIEERPKASSDIGISTVTTKMIKPTIESKTNELDARREHPELKTSTPRETENLTKPGSVDVAKPESPSTVAEAPNVESAKVTAKRVEPAVGSAPLPMPRKTNLAPPKAPKRRLAPLSTSSRTLSYESERINRTDRLKSEAESKEIEEQHNRDEIDKRSSETTGKLMRNLSQESIEDDVFLTPIAGTPIDPKPGIFNNQLIESSKETNSKGIDLPKSEITMEENSSMEEKLSVSENKKLCTIISTMPKCEHLDDGRDICEILTVETSPKDDTNHQIEDNNSKVIDSSVMEENRKPNKIVKMHRSPSKSNDFETNSLEKQKRHLTSHAEDITFALNMNVSSNLSTEVDRVETRRREKEEKDAVEEDKGIAVAENSPSKTDILLQKVSDTLSNVAPSSVVGEVTSTTVESSDETFEHQTKLDPISNVPLENAKDFSSKELSRKSQKLATNNSLNETSLNSSGEHPTSQQDTSDYVSAVDDDLSIPDWEYQLPAPPSAFRDTASPVFENSDTVTLGSVEAFKEPIADIVQESSARVDGDMKKISVAEQDVKEEIYVAEEMEKPRKKKNVEDKVEELLVEKAPLPGKKTEASLELKKEVISELENKIGSGNLSQVSNREADPRKITDDTSTPKIAPVDNTLSNFTITTYTRQKNLSIFDEVDGQQIATVPKISDERFIKSFPTLSRVKNHHGNEPGVQNTNLHDVELRKPEPKIQEGQNRWQSANGSEKAAVHRSRSYISAAENMKQNLQTRDSDRVMYSDNVAAAQRTEETMKKSTSVTNLNMDAPKGNEKFSQWRENILKRQEEPTKEKQLQSLQVLKSILPQLKNAQQAEENVPKEPITSVIPEESRCETRSNEHSTESNVVSTEVSQTSEQKRQEPDTRKTTSEENNAKRYMYSGPPAITLGSWSERPNVNVQIKMDTDYKFGGANKIANGKTIVSINGVKLERDRNEPVTKSEKNWEQGTFIKQEKEDKTESDELAKKLITHTTATGFKKPVLNKVNMMESKRTIEKPIVTGVELKKTVTVKTETDKSNESSIDTSPLNFKELTKAFGEVRLRPKPRRLINNRYSEHYDAPIESNQRVDLSVRQNGHCELSSSQSFSSETQNNVKPRRFTSVIGISQSQNGDQTTSFPFKSGINVAKNNPPMPVVKGFKIAAPLINGNTSDRYRTQNGIANDTSKPPQPPKPPTMPIITGVTLKTSSARPKSMPVQIDPRDMLLESIRNFGGRGNLKSAVQRC